jgi:hypothetical protein
LNFINRYYPFDGWPAASTICYSSLVNSKIRHDEAPTEDPRLVRLKTAASRLLEMSTRSS